MSFSRRAALGLIAGAGALPHVAGAASARPSVVATTGMIADTAHRIGGDLIEVHALMGPGVDPHSYRQTRSDIVALTRADLILRHGLYLEAQLEELFARLATRSTLVAVGEATPPEMLIAHPDYDNKFDPHIWMVPELWTYASRAIRDALIALLPSEAEAVAARADAFLNDIAQLDIYARKTLASVPPPARVLLTAHDAFGYFGRAYGFEVIGIQGISTESEAGLNRIGALVEMLVSRGISAVFVESSVSDRNVRALIEGAGAQGHEVRIGGELYSDAMGPDGSYEGTYIGMIDHNVTTIAAALGGNVPSRGMNGRLAQAS
ncbi:metal ABC transporter solute-binding protein, Zn/Mn family [Aquicoccus porphyridii]|uniref:Manganese transporter n=1 Tax=Aquicoccus porphyridii TaxID=1852029 RepID=A0A5A9Z7Y2_9RHOB|nr:zinc ABC transporter substrate-binding protein [Aquicoccus porphyridii]KAA0913306.1 manganese transporter [Aquicoccus porphyridii]RAI52318.1 manganese transporter [Rhodobacteraceae bacterium AsT-22]